MFGRAKGEKFTCGRRHDFLAWQGDRHGEDYWRKDGTCSYCGSISPEALFEAVAAGARLTPTDKNYKVYVDLPERHHTKFYFQHLDDAGQKQFVKLLNDRALNIGEPGYFYRLPFFAFERTKANG